ncbi:hypothetical protein H9Q74_011991 [Fusarium xylarioides]|nr:hypothetical protein H9Q71_012951 [Fusarium xylarioides]KAG5814904.1 hypothetical protein H9Q74_011991 [Fusarium xylarioides]
MSSGDIWSKAIADLGDKLPPDNFKHPENKTLQDLLENTKLSRERLVNKSWSFKRKKGEVVYVRDLLAKASKWIKHFMSVVDITVQCDPVHAGLPWAGVRFLLISQAGEKLRNGLIKLYTSILTYVAKANSYYKQDRFKSFFKNGLLASSEFESAFEDIEKAQADIDRAVDVLSLQEQLRTNSQLKQMIETFNAPVNRWDETLHAITDHRKEEDRRETLRWISDIKYEQHHEQANSEVLRGTGQWLLQDALFVRWKNECASSILWLYGIPGAGKSKLASIVIEDAIEAFQKKQAPHPAYFYCSCDTAEPERSDPTRILASIARQLSTPQRGGPILEPAIKEYEKQKKSDFMSGPLRLEKSKALVLELLQKYNSATIVLDALDEINPNTRETLLEILEDLLNESPCLLKLFVTSRTDQDITYKLNKYPNLHLSSERNTADINLYIESETTRLIKKGHLLRDSNRKGELCRMIIDTLTLKAQGMFRLASLQLNDLRGQETDRAIEERLPQLPETLKETYNKILDKIQNMATIADRQAAGGISIGEGTFMAAAENLRYSEEITAMLLEQSEREIIVPGTTVNVMAAAVRGKEILGLLFDHPRVRILVTEDVLKTAAQDRHMSEETWTFLLKKRGPEVLINEDIVKYAATNPKMGDELIERLLDECGPIIPTTETVVNAILEHLHEPTIELYLNMTGASFNVTKALIDKAVEQRSMDKVDLFLERGIIKDETIEEFMPSILRGCRPITLQGFLDRTGIQIQINEQIVEGAAQHKYCQVEMLALLIERQSGGIPITDLVIESALSDVPFTGKVIEAISTANWDREERYRILVEKGIVTTDAVSEVTKSALSHMGPSILKQFIDQNEIEIEITEENVLAAAKNWGNQSDVMKLMLERRDRSVQITERSIIDIAKNFEAVTLQQIFDEGDANIFISKELLQAAAASDRHGKEVFSFLLDKQVEDLPVTEEIVEAAAGNRETGKDVLALLLERQDGMIPVTEKSLYTMIRSHTADNGMLMLVLERCRPKISITEQMIEKAARNSTEALEMLLDRRGKDLEIAERIVNAAAGKGWLGKRRLAVLLDKCGPGIHITEHTVKRILRNKPRSVEILVLFLQRGISVPVTENILAKAQRNRRHRHELTILFSHFADMQDYALDLIGEEKQQEETNESDAQRDSFIELRGYWSYFCLFSLFVILLSHYLVTF